MGPGAAEQYPPRYSRVAFDVALGYAIIAGLIAGNLYLFGTGVSPAVRVAALFVGAFGIGFFIHFLHLFMHEAAHYNFAPGKGLNDFLSNLLISYWIMQDTAIYRRFHWDHHRRVGKVDDTENSYFVPLTPGRMLLTLTGVYALGKALAYGQAAGPSRKQLGGDARRKWLARLVFLAYHAGVVFALFRLGGWLSAAMLWIIPMFLIFPFFANLRQTCEHRRFGAGGLDFSAADSGAFTRNFKQGPLAYFFGGAGFYNHWFHHLNPYVSYTRYADFVPAVRKTTPEATEVEEGSYLSTILRLIRDSKQT